jgi:hypothetical protein
LAELKVFDQPLSKCCLQLKANEFHPETWRWLVFRKTSFGEKPIHLKAG